MALDRPYIGIISDSPLQRHVLQNAIAHYGLQVSVNCDPGRFSSANVDPVACWILELEDEDAWPDIVDQLLESTDVPVLFGLGLAPSLNSEEYPRWERRLFTKLREEIGELELLDGEEDIQALDALKPASTSAPAVGHFVYHATDTDPVERVCVLAASLGGPAAVKEFLDQLPAGLPVSFIYAQHIDANFSSVLAKVLARHSHFSLKEAEDGDRLKYGEVLMAPVDREMYFDDQGIVRFKETPWPGPYGPSIDQAMLNVANHYGVRCQTIVFSGMGNDGAIAAPLLKAYGCEVWVQSSASCANSSMPDSVAATNCSSYCGTPTQLAVHLVKAIESQIAAKTTQLSH